MTQHATCDVRDASSVGRLDIIVNGRVAVSCTCCVSRPDQILPGHHLRPEQEHAATCLITRSLGYILNHRLFLVSCSGVDKASWNFSSTRELYAVSCGLERYL